jgi:hypothetical protein
MNVWVENTGTELSSADRRRLEGIRQLEALGSTVHVEAVDVTNRSALADLLRRRDGLRNERRRGAGTGPILNHHDLAPGRDGRTSRAPPTSWLRMSRM